MVMGEQGVAHQLDELSTKYVEAYAHLARMNIRSLEGSLAIRRMVIRKNTQTPPDEAGSAERLKVFEATGPQNRPGGRKRRASLSTPSSTICPPKPTTPEWHELKPGSRSANTDWATSSLLKMPNCCRAARRAGFIAEGETQPGADRRAARRIQPRH